MKRLYTTTLRLNLENEADREAMEHLRRLDRKKYRSVNSAVMLHCGEKSVRLWVAQCQNLGLIWQ